MCYTLCVSLLSECVQLIMDDAKKKKRDWQEKLHDMKLKNLLQLRDSLMATASIYMMVVDDCKAWCEDADEQVTPQTIHVCISSSSAVIITSFFLLTVSHSRALVSWRPVLTTSSRSTDRDNLNWGRRSRTCRQS